LNRQLPPGQHVAIEQRQVGLICVTESPRPLHDQLEDRPRITGRSRQHLQHVDGRSLMLDPFVVFAVARR
jgi:hypothetical protein